MSPAGKLELTRSKADQTLGIRLIFVRQKAGMAMMPVGLITDARQAEEIIASGKADLIAIGRVAMYDPRWTWHAAEELGAEMAYAQKMMACHPKLRPQPFPARRVGVA